jgi:ribulose-phosphate 3-epimerase
MMNQVGKMRQIREMIDRCGRPVHLEVDGGINRETARVAREAGCEMLVAGNSVFRAAEGAALALAALRA